MGLKTSGRKGVTGFRAAALLLALCVLLLPSCSRNRNGSASAELFLAPIPDAGAPGGATRALVSRVDFLVAQSPDKLPAELADDTIGPRVLAPTLDGKLLVSDSRSGGVFSVDVEGNDLDDPDCVHTLSDRNLDDKADCERVQLRFSGDGLSATLSTTGAQLAANVPAILLRNGWILAYERTTESIVAFREVEPQEVPDPNGGTRSLSYRTSNNPQNLNFGSGNGYVVSEVVRAKELRERAGGVTVARFYEIEPNKVLLFLTAVGAIHLIDLSEETVNEDWDLENDLPNDEDVLPTPKLVGEIQLFQRIVADQIIQEPFLPFSEIATKTGDVAVNVIDFPPTLIPTDGAALLFDRATSTFLRVATIRGRDELGNETDDVVASAVDVAVRGADVFVLMESFLAGGAIQEFNMASSFLNPAGDSTEILIMEETTNNIIAYDYLAPLGENIRIFVSQSNLVDPRSSGPEGGVASNDPQLLFATRDVLDNRLAFDSAGDQLLSINYESTLLVVVLSTIDLLRATGENIADLQFVQPLANDVARIFDAESAKLLDLRIDYARLEVD